MFLFLVYGMFYNFWVYIFCIDIDLFGLVCVCLIDCFLVKGYGGIWLFEVKKGLYGV